MDSKLKIATGEKFGTTAKTEHVIDAVKIALTKAKLRSASSIILFLTNGYTQNPKLAAKIAGTIQAFGTTASGLFTENTWELDNEGAVVMVFPDDCDLQPASLLNSHGKLESDLLLICLTSPEQSKIALNHFEILMIGAVTSNAYGASEYPIWHASRISKSGFIHTNFVR